MISNMYMKKDSLDDQESDAKKYIPIQFQILEDSFCITFNGD